jgi:hypothetical protein
VIDPSRIWAASVSSRIAFVHVFLVNASPTSGNEDLQAVFADVVALREPVEFILGDTSISTLFEFGDPVLKLSDFR